MLGQRLMASGLGRLVVGLTAAIGMSIARADRAFVVTPDDATNRVLALDAETGALVREFVPPGEHLVAPLDCMVTGRAMIGGVSRASAVLVSDSKARKLVAFDPDSGVFWADFATGVDARGMALAHDGKLLVAAAKSGVRAYDLQTGQFTTRVSARIVDGPANATALLVRPVAALPDSDAATFPNGDLLVADATLDAIFRYDASGAAHGVFAKLPQFKYVAQLAARANMNVLAADTFGGHVYEFDRSGALLRTIDVVRPRGVIELPDGDILIAAESGVLRIDADGVVVDSPVGGYPTIAPRYLSRVGCRGLRGDLDGDGRVSNFDVDPFVLAVIDPEHFLVQYPAVDRVCAGDVNNDGRLDLFDIDPFVECILNQPPAGAPCNP